MFRFNKPEILNQVAALEIIRDHSVYYKVRYRVDTIRTDKMSNRNLEQPGKTSRIPELGKIYISESGNSELHDFRIFPGYFRFFASFTNPEKS